MIFLCPHCGDLKDKLRRAGHVDFAGHEADELNVTICNRCQGMIVWKSDGGPESVRKGTPEEVQEFMSTELGVAVFKYASRAR